MLPNINDYLNNKGITFQPATDDELLLKNCPYCYDNNNHFYLNRKTGLYHCKKCGSKGNFVQFQEVMGDVPGIVKATEYLNSPYKREELEKLIVQQHQNLLSNKIGLDYLANRGINLDSVKKFKLGMDADWIAIPHIVDHIPVSVKYRRINPKEFRRIAGTPSVLFNLDSIDNKLDYVIIVESETDTMKGDQEGIKNIVGITTGAESFQKQWLPFLMPFKHIYICLNSDAVGQRGAHKIAEMIGLDKCLNVILPVKDVNEFLNSHSVDEFNELLKQATQFDIEEITTLKESIRGLDEWLENRDEIRGLKTGFVDLDNILKGMKNEDLIILSGASTTGKTTIALNMINSMLKDKKKVLVFLLEGRIFFFIERLMSIEAGRPITELSKEELQELKTRYTDYQLYFYSGSQSLLAVDKIVEKTKACKKLYNIDLMVLDHLHKIVERGKDNYSALVGRTVSELKNVAVDAKIPVICICHIKKLAKNAVPSMQDLRDSSFIHQDADVVLMLWSNLEDQMARDNVVLKVLKNKTGQDGVDLFFMFNRKTGQFIPVEMDHEHDQQF